MIIAFLLFIIVCLLGIICFALNVINDNVLARNNRAKDEHFEKMKILCSIREAL